MIGYSGNTGTEENMRDIYSSVILCFRTGVMAGLLTLVIVTFNAHGQDDVINTLQILTKSAYMAKAVSNEFVGISGNTNVTVDLRLFAANILANHDASGANSFQTVNAFITGWTMTNEPVISSNRARGQDVRLRRRQNLHEVNARVNNATCPSDPLYRFTCNWPNRH